MSTSELRVVATFLNEIDAELAQSALSAAGIESMISADDVGGLRPHLSLGSGVRLLVRATDVDEANKVLDEPAQD
jgi:hypothetical protein